MPKIEVNEKIFFEMVGTRYDNIVLEKKLTYAKAELDEIANEKDPENKRSIKVELNDTNRPDLWSTAGLARMIRVHNTCHATTNSYDNFLSTNIKRQDSQLRVVKVDKDLKNIRPFITGFVISGKPIDETMLEDIIQTQEKLCHNFGRKRKSFSMGVYRSDMISWPVYYCATDPDKTEFVPLECTEKMSCKQILEEHPKGKEYADILKDCKKYPILKDSKENILSFAPIINSADIGAVQPGDKDLLVELTGIDMDSLLLATNIVACDFADAGYKILPLTIQHPYDTGYGTTITTPYYFQEPTYTTINAINSLLGSKLTLTEVEKALKKMDCKIDIIDDKIKITPPPYRNDFLHEVDIIEDVMLGIGVDEFEPSVPGDFTIGRLLPETQLSRKIKTLMIGFGFQEMIFNYLGSEKDFIEKMKIDRNDVIEIENPMSENYRFVRSSIIPSLLISEMTSNHAVYPHKIFETGQVAYRCDSENTGTTTRQYLGFLSASQEANYNEAASLVSGILYYLDITYSVKESNDPRFIKGRQAFIMANNKKIGIFGEICPEVLNNWEINTPCFAGELDLTLITQMSINIK